MIYTLTLNPVIDKAIYLNDFNVGQVNYTDKALCFAAGKGINVSRALNRFKVENTAYIVGGGKVFDNMLTLGGFNFEIFDRGAVVRENLKICDVKNSLFTDFNEKGEESKSGCSEVFARLSSILNSSDILVLSGSLRKNMSENAYFDLTTLCRQKGAICMLDADNLPLKQGILANPNLVKINIFEFCRLCGEEFDDIKKISAKARTFLSEGSDGITSFIVTLGRDGAILADKTGTYYGKCQGITPIYTAGAGDCFMAALIYCEKNGFSSTDALSFCLAASGLKTMCAPDEIPSLEQINAKIVDTTVSMQ